MGILDTIQQLAGQAGAASGTDQAKVAGGFIEALTQHPEGIQGLINSFKNNGMEERIGRGAGRECHGDTNGCSRGCRGQKLG